MTDRNLRNAVSENGRFVDLTNLHWTKAMAAIEKGYSNRWEDPEYRRWENRVQYGFGRAPLELIAYVVENDLPYTEILTADYIMANPEASEAYGAPTRFDDVQDPREFRPSDIVSYYRDDESKVIQGTPNIGDRVLDPGNLWTDYPHAGILNTTVFLLRYPTTPTNRNRARSRWTYYHFLGLDIEKSASRTTDPDALADTDNPTMKNPACTVCHRVMDPVAGAFQNYGEEGEYRDTWGGQDSLDNFYKWPPDGAHSPYQPGDTWYRDMRIPGFNGLIAPDADNSVQWLAEQIVADDRFAEATVKFWWPAIMGVEVVRPPEDKNDSDFEAVLLASNAQTAEVEQEEESEDRRFGSGLRRQAQLTILAFKARVAVSADLLLGGFDTHANHDLDHNWLLSNLTNSVDFLWELAEIHGVADRLVVVIGSDFGRTNHYNVDSGKDHWPIGSFVVMEKNQPWTNRVVGETDALHFAHRIHPEKLQRDDADGTIIHPKHVHRALRRYLGVENSSGARQFPFHNTEDFAFFG